MAVCCWSLTGLPLTVGFFGKFYLIKPIVLAATGDVKSRMVWLVALLVINAAISAAYYLRIVMAMFIRPEPAPLPASSALVSREIPVSIGRPWPVIAGIYLSVLGTLVLGISLPTVVDCPIVPCWPRSNSRPECIENTVRRSPLRHRWISLRVIWTGELSMPSTALIWW